MGSLALCVLRNREMLAEIKVEEKMREGHIVRDSRGHWQSYDLIDGLPDVDVQAILEDREGYLWFGTETGVSRYDGESFVTFTTEDGLAHNDVWDFQMHTKATTGQQLLDIPA